MRCVVTGAAGFIGSHLCEYLLNQGNEVQGIDAFVPYYPAVVKERNLAAAMTQPLFRLHRLDLCTDPLDEVLEGAEAVFHLAAMPGLTRSWTDFDLYENCNVRSTHRLLEAIRRKGVSLQRVVCASTSSVYGRMASGDESQPTLPISPYGVTKLAGENLCRAYAEAYDLPIVILRYFSVYGPRQRPDMGYFKFIQALLHDEPVVVFGDGQQVRGNTYVADCVAATVAAAAAPAGETYNVGGGEAASVWDILGRLEALSGRPARVRREPARPGDQRHTLADTSKIQRNLGWQPRTPLDVGLANQWAWQSQKVHHSEPIPAGMGPSVRRAAVTIN